MQKCTKRKVQNKAPKSQAQNPNFRMRYLSRVPVGQGGCGCVKTGKSYLGGLGVVILMSTGVSHWVPLSPWVGVRL